ncbi:tRNA pseudouridine(55) synthase TruB [Paratractidigestivibacter sp.]|uniref:tRNA pseudouridine(55) synthase TruB n=1 Tax=Paratractidigestivibacter sp. TaxID=2847316 RepID=UPI002ABE7D46|nr:tRNA pseudouridine(55) synthase TruB [Paratractidigestivibacter sp.]
MRRGPSAVNALIAVDKPLGLSSHDVVNRVRRAVGERRVGHAGTLDPDASGVLVVGIGQATKLLGLLVLDRKGYRARIEFGSATDTDDAQGEVIERAEVAPELLDAEYAAGQVAHLVGETDQIPPAYSAISVSGKRAYALAREGKEVKLKSRRVTIHAARLVCVEGGRDGEPIVWTCDFDVSKGTYIRSIARDLGRSLGTCAHLCGLVRTSAGGIGLADCVGLDELTEKGAVLVSERGLDPVAALGLAARAVEVGEVADIACGRKIPMGIVTCGALSREPKPRESVALVWDHALVGIWERRGLELACSVNFPQAIEGVR